MYRCVHVYTMGWLRLVGSLKLLVSCAEYCLFCRTLLQERPIILRSLLIVATPKHIYMYIHVFIYIHVYRCTYIMYVCIYHILLCVCVSLSVYGR